MKLLTFFVLLVVFLKCFAQQEEFELEGIVIDSAANPVTDAYIINFRTQEKSVSNQNGVFSVHVLPGDSLAILHVSYNRKIIRVFDLIKTPVVKLETDNINIGQVDVSASRKTDYERAMNNVSSISDMKLYDNQKIETEPDRAMQMMIEHNKVLRSEATSLRILRFSPSDLIGNLFKKLKKKKDRKRKSYPVNKTR